MTRKLFSTMMLAAPILTGLATRQEPLWDDNQDKTIDPAVKTALDDLQKSLERMPIKEASHPAKVMEVVHATMLTHGFAMTSDPRWFGGKRYYAVTAIDPNTFMPRYGIFAYPGNGYENGGKLVVDIVSQS